MNTKNLLIIFLLIGAASMLVMSANYLAIEPSGILKGKVISKELWYRMMFVIHVLFGIVAISTGPTQFVNSLRVKWPAFHKWMGYLYALSVTASSIAGFFVAPYAMGGMIPRIGFSFLSLIWLSSLLIGIRHIIKGRVLKHQNWLTINYSLTFAAITQRTLLLIPLFLEVPFMPVYRLSAWLPWIFNLCIALLIIRKNQATSNRVI